MFIFAFAPALCRFHRQHLDRHTTWLSERKWIAYRQRSRHC